MHLCKVFNPTKAGSFAPYIAGDAPFIKLLFFGSIDTKMRLSGGLILLRLVIYDVMVTKSCKK